MRRARKRNIKAKIIKIEEKTSRCGGIFYYVFFKNTEGKSFRTCIFPRCGNYKRWQPIIEKFFKNDGELWLDGLVLKGKGLIDADSWFREGVENEKCKI